MKSPNLILAIAIAVVAAMTTSTDLAAQQATTSANKAQHHHYKFIDLGTLGGPNSGVPTGFFLDAGAQVITNQGIVIGTADTSIPDPLCFFDDCFYPHAFRWKNGAITDLGALPGAQWSTANWISGNGLTAGISQNGQTDPLTGTPEARAVLWRSKSGTDLGTLAGGYESFASAVNNRGQVVGFSTNGTPDPYSYFYFGILGVSTGMATRAYVWDAHNGMQELGSLGGPDSWAAFINNQGQIAGISYTSPMPNSDNGPCAPNVPSQSPFFWDDATGIVDVGTLGGTCGVPNAFNNRGQMVGQSYLTGNVISRAFLWDKKSTPPLLDLGTLGGDNASALWISDAGALVGYADLPNPPGCKGLTCVHHAFLWKDVGMTDLGSIGTDPCSHALSVNSKGQVVGFTEQYVAATRRTVSCGRTGAPQSI
jgi:probable HAF family extracellular repeat protein